MSDPNIDCSGEQSEPAETVPSNPVPENALPADPPAIADGNSPRARGIFYVNGT